MEKITLKTFGELMSDGKYAADSVEIAAGEGIYRAERNVNVVFVVEDGVPSFKEEPATYSIIMPDGKKKHFSARGELKSYVNNNLADNGCINVVKIGGFDSLEAFRANADFSDIGMAQLLEKYGDCDEFSLTCPYNEYDGEHPDGIYRLESADGEKAFKLISFEQRDMAGRMYALAPASEKEGLPPFDELYDDIMAEVEALGDTEEAACDMFAEDKMKYKGGSSLLWHIYHAAGFVRGCRKNIDLQYKNTQTRPIDSEFDGELYAPLKPYISRVLVTYCWHCTVSGSLAKVFYIKLNGKTKEWLLQFKNDYELEGLDDLAFYKDGNCRFSSCTHEGFHNDIPQEE